MTLPLARPGPMVEVEWIDSNGSSSWHDRDHAIELLTKLDCRSVGYLLEDKPAGIVIVQGIGSNADQVLASMAIPRAAIVSMKTLRSDE